LTRNGLATATGVRQRASGPLLTLLGAAALLLTFAPAVRADIQPAQLRCEYLSEPLAVEEARPRLFWQLRGTGRGERQSAYQILVASSREKLAAGEADLWDSGRVESPETIQVPYGGKTLASGQQAFWKVRSWDAHGKASPWSPVASWTAGLLRPEDWRAKWVGRRIPNAVPPIPLTGAKWLWHAADPNEPGAGTRYFRKTFEIPADARINGARLGITADDRYTVALNGGAPIAGPTDNDSWRSYQMFDVASRLRPGTNTILIEAKNLTTSPAGVLARLVVNTATGDLAIATGEDWETAPSATGPFAPPRVIGDLGVAPWGNVGPGNPIKRTPPPYFRKSFAVRKPVTRALLYATALGAYELSLNGKRVSDDVLSPGWTDFRKRVPYLAYDVTKQLKQGENALGAILGDGWYASYLAFTGKHHFYGGETRLRLQLNVSYADGTRETIGTDDTWKTADGPIKSADLLMGSVIDTRAEMRGWDAPGFDDTGWKPAAVQEAPELQLVAKPNEPIRPTQVLTARKRTEPKPGVYVYDFGQNMVGWVRLKVNGKPGQTIQLRHAEFLNPDGTLYTTNLRSARATDTFILKGGPQTLEPAFTFHGFQYVEITGAAPAAKDVQGVVVHSDVEKTLTFESDNPELNRLVENIDWGFRGNALDVPTDCPQRDERAGWTGDAQVFAKTSMFHRDTAAFYTKWLLDVQDGQFPDGSYPDVAPSILGGGNAAWEDAGVICVYRMYEMYGDTGIIRRQWASMTRFLEHLARVAPDGIRQAGAYGDWLLLEGPQKSDIHGTAYYYRSAFLMAEMAAAIGKAEEAATYRALADRVKAKFIEKFVAPDGKVTDGGKESQTFYALALGWDLLPEAARPGALGHLKAMLRRSGNHLTTGFIGTPLLLDALARAGDPELANVLLLQDTYPSWLYQVKLGATTMWERWDGWTPEKGFQNPGMNSFNHYWLGCVGEWIYTGVAGIDTDGPGWSRITLCPRPAAGLGRARLAYDSIRGRIESGWSREKDGGLSLDFTVPANVTATVYVPAKDAARVRVDGKPADRAEGVRFVRQEGDAAVFAVGSGKYRFQVVGE
jgi:Alpha-L-rhamnosidase N-terminal domain./Bacterial alpha-L-rhamnosidase.